MPAALRGNINAYHLPGNFLSIAHSIEELAFAAKDALMVVDHFAPTGGMGNGALYALAERLFRSAGNRQGRSRMGGRTELRTQRPPRALLLLASGEEVPSGHSLCATPPSWGWPAVVLMWSTGVDGHRTALSAGGGENETSLGATRKVNSPGCGERRFFRACMKTACWPA